METLKEIRKNNGLKLADVAKKLGVTPGYVSHLETGRFKPTVQLIGKLANALGVSEKKIREVILNTDHSKTLQDSWITGIKINGYPVIEAFTYNLLANKQGSLKNKETIKRQLIEFVADNIKNSLVAELESNKSLMPLLIERVNQTKHSK